ncbi:MAG: VCBS repeat-containing protein, partial [Deltaproteobacteria bacterium]|nr:VCBS repeat-containing protein [Deltaproteobacteria bacterium]MBW2536814.1 VCBS repeat-containing protein [Deltaproteobacteria bacterium]
YDSNCDGKVDIGDPPQMIFVSANSQGTCCQCGTCACGSSGCAAEPSCCQTGVLRMLDGATGQEIWSLNKAKTGPQGFAGTTVAIGDVDGDQSLDIVALTGDGYVALIDALGNVVALSDARVPDWNTASFGWGGGLSLGDMDNDGVPEIAFAHTLFTWDGTNITRQWVGAHGTGGAVSRRMSHFVDLDLDGDLELLAGNTPYNRDGSTLWTTTAINALPNNFTAIGDFDKNGTPEVVFIASGQVHLVNGADGSYFNGWSPANIRGGGNGGPPTVADFDGDGYPEIGVAMQDFYSVMKPDFTANAVVELWYQSTHDYSSSLTGSSVFDFEGDGKAEVVYNDECFQWVYDGTDGTVLLVSYTQSFTGTEASIVADVDGDGHAELVIMANGASPTSWHCAHHTQDLTPISPHTVPMPIWQPPTGASDYRGITVLGDAENSWVGTRTLWNQHPYNVTNICDPRDSACAPGSYYGQIPQHQQKNWQLDWLNNFRQNVQDDGLFDAPDAVVSLTAACVDPVAMQVSVRNIGLSGLPAGIDVEVVKTGSPEVQLGIVTTTIPLMPGQTQVLDFTAPSGQATTSDTFVARILIPSPPTFHECKEDNNESNPISPECVQ